MTDKMMLADKGLVLGAVETTYGVDAVSALIAANGALTFLSVSEDWDQVLAPVFDTPNELAASAGGIAHQVFEDHTSLSGTGFVRAGLGANNLPALDHIYQGANYQQVSSAAGVTVYRQRTIQQKSYSEWIARMSSEEEKWQIALATGARNNLVYNFEAGKEPKISRSGQAASSNDYTAYAAFFNPATLTPLLGISGATLSPVFSGTQVRDASLPLRCESMVLTIGGTNYPMTTASLDLGWTPTAIKSAQASPITAGIKLTRGATAKPNGSLLLQDGGAALTDVKAKWASGASATLQIVASNATRKCTWDITNVQLGYYSNSKQNNLIAHQVPFFVLANSEANNRAGEGWITKTFAMV